MNVEQKRQIYNTNVLSIAGILEEAELKQVTKRKVNDWFTEKQTPPYFMGTTEYTFQRVTLHSRLGLLYCTTRVNPEKERASICALTREDLENELLATPENLLERRGKDFDSLKKAIEMYDQIRSLRQKEKRSFLEYLTSS